MLAHFQCFFGRTITSLGTRNRDAFWENEGKIHERMCERVFFVNFQAGISQFYYRLTSSQIFSGILSTFKILKPSNGYLSFLHKMLEKCLWNSFLLHLVVEILQPVHEISSFPEVLYKKRCSEKLLRILRCSHPESSGGVLWKDVLKNFAKFTEQTSWRLKAGNLKLAETAAGDDL